jgi:hypothetical protein
VAKHKPAAAPSEGWIVAQALVRSGSDERRKQSRRQADVAPLGRDQPSRCDVSGGRISGNAGTSSGTKDVDQVPALGGKRKSRAHVYIGDNAEARVAQRRRLRSFRGGRDASGGGDGSSCGRAVVTALAGANPRRSEQAVCSRWSRRCLAPTATTLTATMPWLLFVQRGLRFVARFGAHASSAEERSSSMARLLGMALRKPQRNDVFTAIHDEGLSPDEFKFEWDAGVDESSFRHVPSGACFVVPSVAGNYSSWFSAGDEPVEERKALSWYKLM